VSENFSVAPSAQNAKLRALTKAESSMMASPASQRKDDAPK